MTSKTMQRLTLAVAVCVTLASLIPPAATTLRHMAGQIEVAPLLPAGQAADPNAAPAQDTSSLRAFAPFGSTANVQRSDVPTATGDLPDAQLHGVLVSAVPELSRALMSVDGQMDSYRIGDLIGEDARLVVIETQSVELATSEGRAILRFEDDTVSPISAKPTDATATNPPSDGALERLAQAIVPGRGALDVREPPPPETTSEYIALWRDRIRQDPQAVLDTIGLVAGDSGYTIAEDPNIGVRLAGLQPGDLVTRVNGRQVGDPSMDRTFYDEVAAAGHARLEIVRDGKRLLMSFNLR